jgi:hypothetical protein
MKRLSNTLLLLPCLAFTAVRAADLQGSSAPDATAITGEPAESPFDAQQLPGVTGTIEQFTLTPRGEIDGLILTDGTEVQTPPHLSTAVAFSIRPGDTVLVRGLRAASLPLMQAVSITDQNSHRTIVDTAFSNRPRGPGRPLPPVTSGWIEEQGAIRMDLHGRRGELNGALLRSGTVLRLPPQAAADLTELLQPGKTVVAQGEVTSNAVGKVIAVRSIGASHAAQVPVEEGPPPPPRGPLGRPGAVLPRPPPPPAAPPPPPAPPPAADPQG